MFYVETLAQKYPVNIPKCKIMINAVASVIIISQVRSLCIQFQTFTIIFEMQDWRNFWILEYEIAETIMDYVTQCLPFFLSITVISLI